MTSAGSCSVLPPVIEVSTVKSHVQTIYTKLDVHNRTQALQVRAQGLIP